MASKEAQSGLSEAENEFSELLERCKLPEITRQEILERFFAQSTPLLEARKELETLRGFRAAVVRASDQSFGRAAPASPPRLSVVPRGGA